MKGKYCCFNCRKKLMKNARFGESIPDGWTTGNCTVQLMIKDVGPKNNNERVDN